MQGGFTFDGVDIAALGLEYAPENQNTYVYNRAPGQLQEQKMEAHEGGYFYGVSIAPKDFILRCFFERSNVRDGIITAINSCFKVGKTGRLVFAKRPWCWYTATVVETDTSKMLNFENGIVNIKMRAYYPYARADMSAVDTYADKARDIVLNSAFLANGEELPPTHIIENGQRLTELTPVPLFNPGTERAKVAIEIAGDVGDGVTISNSTTNQICTFVVMRDADTTNVGKYIVSDALNGKTVLTDGSTSELKFLYHDNGFLELEPAYPVIRNVKISYTANATAIQITSDELVENVVGKYIYVNNAWRKIAAQPAANQLTVSVAPTETGTATTDIVLMNEITVKPVSTMSLSRLNFIYYPTFS